jgi:hypothetical protein
MYIYLVTNEWVWSAVGMILTGENEEVEEKHPFHSHFVHHKVLMDRPGISPTPPF